MTCVSTETRGDLALLRMEHGKVQALDVELCQALTRAAREFEASSHKAAVLSGTGSCFSAGVDLRRILDGGAEYVARFLPALDEMLATLFALNKPLVAAINGHAIAGGCVIACACDWRVMGDENGRIGVPELQVGVAYPWIALEIMRIAVRPDVFQEMVFLGTQFEAADARSKGVVHDLAPAAQVHGCAQEIAQRLAQIPRQAFALAKQQERTRILQGWRASSDHHARVLALWQDPATHASIREYLGKTLGKPR